jgi:hypothetical protein
MTTLVNVSNQTMRLSKRLSTAKYFQVASQNITISEFCDEFKVLNGICQKNHVKVLNRLSIEQLQRISLAIDFFGDSSIYETYACYVEYLLNTYSLEQMTNVYYVFSTNIVTEQLFGNIFMHRFSKLNTDELNCAYHFINESVHANRDIYLNEWKKAIYTIEKNAAIEFFEYHIEQHHERKYPFIVEWSQLYTSGLSKKFIKLHRKNYIQSRFNDDDHSHAIVLSLYQLPFDKRMSLSAGKYHSDDWLATFNCYNDQWYEHGINYDSF